MTLLHAPLWLLVLDQILLRLIDSDLQVRVLSAGTLFANLVLQGGTVAGLWVLPRALQKGQVLADWIAGSPAAAGAADHAASR